MRVRVKVGRPARGTGSVVARSGAGGPAVLRVPSEDPHGLLGDLAEEGWSVSWSRPSEEVWEGVAVVKVGEAHREEV